MDVPAVHGTIDRRILANYRINPDALADVLPGPFEPWTVGGHGVGGICLIRMTDMRPPGVPAALGMGSENAAHRIAVEWDGDGEEGERRRGVYVPRRDTDSWLQVLFGSRLFSGSYSHATFDTEEVGDRYAVEMASDDGAANVSVDGRVAEGLPADSVFPDLHAASEFFRKGSLGYAPADPDGGAADAGSSEDGTTSERTYEGVELDTETWNVEPLAVDRVHSGFFEGERFADDAVSFDCALLMRDVDHAWRQRESICAPPTADG